MVFTTEQAGCSHRQRTALHVVPMSGFLTTSGLNFWAKTSGAVGKGLEG